MRIRYTTIKFVSGCCYNYESEWKKVNMHYTIHHLAALIAEEMSGKNQVENLVIVNLVGKDASCDEM